MARYVVALSDGTTRSWAADACAVAPGGALTLTRSSGYDPGRLAHVYAPDTWREVWLDDRPLEELLAEELREGAEPRP